MVTTDLKKILAERETGTAVNSARTLPWQNSVVFDPSLHLEIDPLDLYQFNARLYLEPGFQDTFLHEPAALLRELQVFDEAVSEQALAPILDRNLSKEERQALLQVMATAQRSLSSQEELEAILADDGYGLPAIAALILVVAVAVTVYLWVS